MANHWDTTAPLAGRVDQRQGHIIARIIGTLALAGFMLGLATGTARAGALGDIVEELPVDIGLGQEATPAPAPPTEPDPNPEPSVESTPQEPSQSDEAAGLGEVIEGVAEPVVQPVKDIVAPVADAVEEPVRAIVQPVDAVQQPVREVVDAAQPVVERVDESVGEIVQPVVGTVEGPVTQVVEQVAPVIAGMQRPLDHVIDPTLDLIEDTPGSVPGLVDEVLDQVNGIVNVTGLLDGPLELISGTDDLIGELVDTIGGNAETGSNPAGPLDPGTTPDGWETPATGPPRAGRTSDDLVPLPVHPEAPGVPNESAIQIGDVRSPVSEKSPEAAPASNPTLLGPSSGGHMGLSPIDDGDESTTQTRLPRGASTSPFSSSGPAAGLVAVLVLLGLIAPRLSRWLRPRLVLWRPIALAEALELPG